MTFVGKSLSRSLVAVALLLLAAPTSWAQTDILKVEVGKTMLLQVPERPEVIFIADPSIVDIVIERAGVMFLVGRQTGETNMRMLGADGDTLLHAAIVVVPQEARHLTLNRSLSESTYSCNPRCSGVANPHAAGASIAGADRNVSRENSGTSGDAPGGPRDAAPFADGARSATGPVDRGTRPGSN